MDASRYTVLHGHFVLRGHAPDGDSVRFVPDRVRLLDSLRGQVRLRLGEDAGVQVRLEG